ncbi:MAG: hypothetical protein SFZ02_14590 [bacterium]|nr:hypothetical protein [bacterium]
MTITLNRAGQLLGFIPLILLVLWLIAYGSSDYPYGDTYTFSARTAIATVDNTLTIDHFLQISNGHRILFSRLVTAFLTITTQWDTRLEVVINVLLACLNVWLSVRLIKKFAPSVVPLAWFPIALLLLSVDQMINWVSGVQSLWHFTLFCLLMSLNILTGEKRRWWRVLMVAFLGVFATFSAGNGMVIWACIGGGMLILRYDRRKIGLMMVIGALAVAGYLYNSGIGASDSANVEFYGQIKIPLIPKMIQTILIFIGRPLSQNADIAPFIGLLGVILFYYALVTSRRGVWLWGMVGLYALLSGAQIALTRIQHFDVGVAFAERYFSISISFWVALCAMWLVRLSPTTAKGKTRLAGFPFLIVILICGIHLIALSTQAGKTDWHNPVNHAMLEGECIRRYPITRQPICDNWIVPDPALTDRLFERKLSGFAHYDLITGEN